MPKTQGHFEQQSFHSISPSCYTTNSVSLCLSSLSLSLSPF